MSIKNMYDVINWLKEQPKNVDSEIINYLITNHITENKRIIKRHDRFLGLSTGFNDNNRKKNPLNKINYKMRFNFWNKIIFEKMGYMSNPLNVSLDKQAIEYKNHEELYNKHLEIIRNYIKYTKFNDKNNESLENTSIFGYDYRYFYVDRKKNIQSKNINPNEIIVIYDEQGIDIEFVLRYYSIQVSDFESRYRVEWYTDKEIFYFNEVSTGKYELTSKQVHGFDNIPFALIKNNFKKIGDCELLITGKIFDTYDFTSSDLYSEFAQLRLAYLFLKNAKPDKEMLQAVLDTGIFGFKGDNVEMNFITKNVDSTPVLKMLESLEEKIYYLSNSANINDSTFGNLSGIAAQYKLFYLEMKSLQLKNQLINSVEKEFELILSLLAKVGITINPNNLIFDMQFNKVINYKEEAETAIIEQGILDQKTILRNMSKVKDVDKVIESKKEDMKQSILESVESMAKENEQKINDVYGNIDNN